MTWIEWIIVIAGSFVAVLGLGYVLLAWFLTAGHVLDREDTDGT
jgi:hypothetical protein